MTSKQIPGELEKIARRLARWKAQRRAAVAGGAILTGLWMLTLSDLVLRYERNGRLLTWCILLSVIVAGLWLVKRAWSRRLPPDAVAARVEKAFPQLDNHLINHVQFSALPAKDRWVGAYLQAGVPVLGEIDIESMKNRRAQRRASFALLGAAALLFAPALWSGTAWTNAFLRIVNPFSTRPPSTLARILEVRPGNRDVPLGSAVLFECRAKGKRGQEVLLEILPADDARSIISLGKFEGSGAEEFSYHVSRVTTDIRYRFRAGDDRSDIHRIQTFPPLAFSLADIEVKPPGYTGLNPRRFNLLEENAVIPEGSSADLRIAGNHPLASAKLIHREEPPLELTASGEGVFHAFFKIREEPPLQLKATGKGGLETKTDLKLQVLPDQAPGLRILAPSARVTLGPGARPRIAWEAFDDYGLKRVVLEQLAADAGPEDPGQTIAEWETGGERHAAATWTGSDAPEPGVPVVYRMTAMDNRPGEPNRTGSPLIVFDVATASDMTAKEKATLADSAASFSRMVNLQRRTLAAAEKLSETMEQSQGEQWHEIGTGQSEVRRLAGALLANPVKPLGPMSETVRKLFHGPMEEVLDMISRIMAAEEDGQNNLAPRIVARQRLILRLLTGMEEHVETLEENRDISGLIAFLDSLLRNQLRLIEDTRTAVAPDPQNNHALASRQDRLANEVFEFMRMSRSQSSALQNNHREYALTLNRVADYCSEHQAAPLMLIAAEHLENKTFDLALTPQHEAYDVLAECMAMLNTWRGETAAERMETFRDALAAAREKFEELLKVQSQVVDSIRQVAQQEDMSGEDMDHLGAELGEIREQMKESMLKIANDLHIFPELPVGNDLIQDVFQVFEDVEQIEGSEEHGVMERLIGKNQDGSMELLEFMEDFNERLVDMETWLPAAPTEWKIEAESFDHEEFPNPIPVLPMPAEMEDIIGDLLKVAEDNPDIEDTATNIMKPDFKFGGEIGGGQFTVYSDKGQSGNEPPEHKEQDGRSGIGREGMSGGETTAGSGMIHEGDEDIQARMTQDPAQSGYVDEMGEEADAVATGGGKQAGHTDELGMSGLGPRHDPVSDQPSAAGWAAMMRRDAEALYARASLSYIRTGSLDEAIRHFRHAEDALNKGMPMEQVHEHRRRAAAALRRTLTELGPDVHSEDVSLDRAPQHLGDKIMGTASEAPAMYRGLVSQYFKALSDTP